MRPEQSRKGGANLVDDLEQQWTGQTIFEVGRHEAADVVEIVPDRAVEQVLFQRRERRRAEQVIDADGAPAMELIDERVTIGALAQRAPRQLRGAADLDGGVVVLAEEVDL